MKKLLYLLFTITLLGCGSNDDNNVSTQTFLEKYDGKVWKNDGFLDDDYDWWRYVVFNNDNQFFTISLVNEQGEVMCYDFYDGEIDEDGYLHEIIENNEERLLINWTFVQDNNQRGTLEYTVNQNKLILRGLESETPEDEFGFFSEYFFDIPCN